MSIVNVNSFESRVSNENYLTTYTNEYLRQSLANLGQRLSVKGDSITSASFKVKDLFNNYLGSFSRENMLAEFKYNPVTTYITANLMLVGDKGQRTALTSSTIDDRADANSYFELTDTNGVIFPDKDNYDGDFMLPDDAGVNSSKYWHRDGSIIARVFDKEENSDALLFKITGHASSGSKGDYDNEYICDEVTTKGEFVSGFRICMSNERNLMIDDESDSKEGKNENLVMLWLKKNPKYIKDSKDSDKKHQWLLSCYKANINNMDIGHFTNITDDDIAIIAKEAFDNTGTLKPDDIVKSFITELSEVAISITQSTQPLFSKIYELGIDFDTNSNVSWSLPDDQTSLIKDYELCQNANSKDQIWKNADQNDVEFIRTKLNYFTADLTQIFPVMQSAYDTIVYHDADNLKLKRQIIGELVKQCYEEFASTDQTGSDLQKIYTVCMPVDLTIKYNGNSNDSSIIYNTVSSISVQFVPVGSDEEGAIDINNLLYSISNHVDQDGNIIDNKQLVVANGRNYRSALYDLSIEYIDDKIVDTISWYQTFQLPYIDSKGTWIVNGVDTQVSAKGSNDNSSGLVIISSGINHDTFIPESDIIFSADKDALALFDWQRQNFATDYIDDNGNIGSSASFIMQAYLPTEESLAKYAQTSYISYLTNSLIMVMSSVKDEKDNIAIECVYNDASYNDVSTIYKDRYEKYGTYYLGTYEGRTVPSYIYTKHYKEDSLAYLLGTDGVVTSFWKCEKVSDGANTTYKMTYLRKPNNSLVALDIPFMASFEKYIKHYANNAFSPDNYKHRWLVFDQVNTELKNNTLDNTEKIYPLIRNYDSTYFSKVGLDPSRALGEKELETDENNFQYQNDLNLSIEFTDAIHKNSDNEITGTYNSLDGRRFEIGQDYKTINQPLTYVDTYIDNDGNTHTYLAQRIDQIKEKYGYIPYSIPYTYFEKEYIPNSKYDANSDVKRNVYPLLNLKEVLVHNINTLNRNNIISVAREKFNGDITKTLLYYAYIGVPFDSDDKSHLKIGTSNIDPNLGTTTMTSYDSLKRLTPMKSVDVEFSYINLAGDTFVSGNLTTDKTQWERKEIKDNGLEVVTYSTIAKPIGILQDVNKTDDTPLDTNFSLLSEVHFKTDEQNYPYKSRYYKNAYVTKIGHNNDTYRSVSYLNINKLLEENGIAFDSQTCFYGDATVLTKRAGTYVGDEVFNAKVALSNFAINYYGAFCDLVRYVNNDKNSTDLNDLNNLNPDWYGAVTNNEILRNYIQNHDIDGFKNDIIDPCLKHTQGIFTTWHQPTNSDENKSCYLGIKTINDKPITAYFDIADNRIDETYTFVEDSYAPYYDTSSMRLTYAGWFLELSTDLCNNENRQLDNKYWKDNEGDTRKIVASNPIHISYTDIYSYDIISNVPKYKKVYAYMFVDGSKEAKYTARYATENNENAKKKVELDPGHENYSYNEVWNCTGCDLCSNYTCKLIGICNHSSVQGSYKPSFGFFVIDDDNKLKGNDLTQYLQSKADEHVYKYQHKRMGQKDDGTAYTYFVDAYYPVQDYVAVVGNRDQRFKKVKRINEGKTEYLDWKGAWITYDPDNKGYDISEPAYVIPVGHNIVCTYDYIYVTENNKLALGTSTYYKISKNKSNVTYSVSGTTTETKTTDTDINGTYTYSWPDENPTYTYVREYTMPDGTVASKSEIFNPGNTQFYHPKDMENASSYTYSYLIIKRGQKYDEEKPYSYDNPIMTSWDEYYKLEDGASVDDTPINISYKTTNSEKTSFSYMELREGEDTQIVAKLTRRHINIRELMTNNSDAQYFNGDLSNGSIDKNNMYTLPKNNMDPASLNEMKPDIQPIVKDKDGNIVSGEKVNTTHNTIVNIEESKDKNVNNG